MPTYAVTGASGHLGRRVVEHLLERDVPAAEIVAVVRTPGKAADLARHGVVVREGDYSRPDTLADAVAGVRRLLLVSGTEVGRRVEQHTAVIEAARDAGVERVLYTSILRAGTTANPIAPDHRGTEEALRASGVPFTVLRNGWYLENYTDRLAEYVQRGEILSAAGTGRVSAATRDDFAAAAATALLGQDDADDAHHAVHELGGPSFSFDELAATVTEVTGRTVVHRPMAAAELAAVLQGAGLDAGTAGFVAALDESIARGELETDSDDLVKLLGRPAATLREALEAARS